MKKILLIILLALIGVTSVQLWATKDRTDQKNAINEVDVRQDTQVGGGFTLTDQRGNVVHDTDFRGKVMVVFFGFTHCPEICPVTIGTLSKMMGLLGDKGSQVQPVFISVDPERDTPAVMADYLKNFDKSIVGLTGTMEQIRQVSDEYKVYFAKVDNAVPPGGEEAKKEDSHDYNIDHSGYIYLMGKDGQFIKVLPYNVPEDELARAVKVVLD